MYTLLPTVVRSRGDIRRPVNNVTLIFRLVSVTVICFTRHATRDTRHTSQRANDLFIKVSFCSCSRTSLGRVARGRVCERRVLEGDVNNNKHVTESHETSRTRLEAGRCRRMNIINLISLFGAGLLRVRVEEGFLEGTIAPNKFGFPFISFKGIPFAEPPVGKLRFKAPRPKTPWIGIRNAKDHASECFQYKAFNLGSEDCLYLNVYTPNLSPKELLPVMVYIHEGGFVIGSGNDAEHGPHFLVKKNVILVTFNYRLDVLGFLSLDTEDIPGNAGMKDQVAALRWIKKNIKQFGGDPENITIFGESAGGASVSFHLVSPMSKGLFNRAIVQSGSLTAWWSNTFRARDRGKELAKQLGCTSNDDKQIYKFLINQPVENLLNRKVSVTFAHYSKESLTVYFGVVSEKQFGNNERFFYGHPFEVLRNGIHEGVQVMNGYTADEGVLYFTSDVQADKVFEQANRFLDFFVPEPYTIYSPLNTQIEIGLRFKEFYMKNEIVSKNTLDDLLRYLNLEMIVYGTISFQKILSSTNRNKHFLYKFTCVSELNYFTAAAGLDHLFNRRPMTSHADDLAYIFLSTRSNNIDVESEAFKMIDQVTTLWTNFAKYGDPTPDDTLGVKWLPYNVTSQHYLNIGKELVPRAYPEKKHIHFWEQNFKEFLPEYVP